MGYATVKHFLRVDKFIMEKERRMDYINYFVHYWISFNSVVTVIFNPIKFLFVINNFHVMR